MNDKEDSNRYHHLCQPLYLGKCYFGKIQSRLGKSINLEEKENLYKRNTMLFG
jgi:hypothetical protein